MSGIFIFLLIYLVFTLYKERKIKKKILSLFIVSFMILLVFIMSRGNFYYVYNALMYGMTSLGKMQSFFQTFEFVNSNIFNLFFGAGAGNFSSRIAFIFSGDYVSWIPDNLIYASNEFINNALTIYQHNIYIFHNSGGTANQPFSFYNTLLGEYGLLGVIIFIYTIFIKSKNYFYYSKLLLLLLCGYFILDYLPGYLVILPIFEILYFNLYFINKQNKEFLW